MACPGWRTTDALSQRLERDYRHFNFYQLVRLFLLARRARSLSVDQRLPATPVSSEELDRCLRFRANLDAAFPGREIDRIEPAIGPADPDADSHSDFSAAAGSPLQLTLNNYTIAGYQGPLPDTYVEWLRDQLREGNPDLADFLDLFNHRFNVLRYLLKTRHRPALESTQPDGGATADYLSAVMGMFTTGLAEQLPLPRRTLLGLAGLLSNPRRSPPMIEAVLRAYLHCPVQLDPLQGDWRPIEEDDQIRLGQRNHRLGSQTILGQRHWFEQAAVRITIGPLDFDRANRLLPPAAGQSAPDHQALVALLHFLVQRQCDCWLRLQVRQTSIPPLVLQGHADNHEAGDTPRLGYSAWLGRPAHWYDSAHAVATAAGPVRLIEFTVPAHTAPAQRQREAA